MVSLYQNLILAAEGREKASKSIGNGYSSSPAVCPLPPTPLPIKHPFSAKGSVYTTSGSTEASHWHHIVNQTAQGLNRINFINLVVF